MDMREYGEPMNRGTVTVQWPPSEEDIETIRNVLVEYKRVRWIEPGVTGDVSDVELDMHTRRARMLLLDLGVDFNSPGIYWVDVDNASKYDHDAWYAASQRGNRILNYDGDDITDDIVRAEQWRRKQSTLGQITDEIISMMQRGELPPWKKPWIDGRIMRPRNAHGRRYRGINVFRLARIAAIRGYESSIWLTRNQAEKVGHPVCEGEPGTLVIGMWHGPSRDEDEERIHTRRNTVFNWEQREGVEKENGRQETLVLPEAQTTIDKYLSKERQRRLKLELRQSQYYEAYYMPSDDRIVVPHPDRFPEPSLYYLTTFHEIAHSTGHEKRLNRRDGNRPAPFGSHDRGQEELVAEMTATFLAAETNLTFSGPVLDDSASYLNGWLDKRGYVNKCVNVIRRRPSQASCL